MPESLFIRNKLGSLRPPRVETVLEFKVERSKTARTRTYFRDNLSDLDSSSSSDSKVDSNKERRRRRRRYKDRK